ncbi:hypothetical protein VOLCADRAFT_82105 [Volvox carteri f. nagariensis]|uniref:Phosphatidic acid phosphatase type 2/haloperoxidase domain-containing protein n=1 Tax=Volvox carteri f. nagariensis TaxID=3068 RepID=D8U3B0_VOLCA|nr:uncharacterized protein VOLCADRAFT_82105 [Volvox carteri f. nagariensis]EFJ45722.1 hypothetical protein VOLCADRAFT_82105 [Volvox carteri f. nagariensis]|eukprot:XP_002953123.1 hypothetical protein VOLCADRAFT_82105 [Volvox carteri f. nagariensis]
MTMNAPLGVEQGADDVEAHLPDAPKERKMTFRIHCSCPIILDWLAALACLVLALGLEKASPKNRFVLKDTLYWNSFPHKQNTVPSWSVPVYALVGPLVLMLVARFVQQRPWRELARLWAALCLAFFLTGAITNCLKLPVGRLRPNFVRTCWPNGTRVFTREDEWGGYAVCDPSVPTSDLEEIRKSWPSGHSSLSAAGLGFTSLYLLGQLRPFSRGTCLGRLWRLLVALLPSFGAVAVGVTRVLDYWHFTSDVLTGLAIGFITAYAVYRSIYPGLTDSQCNLQLDTILAERTTSTSAREMRRVEAF